MEKINIRVQTKGIIRERNFPNRGRAMQYIRKLAKLGVDGRARVQVDGEAFFLGTHPVVQEYRAALRAA